MAAPTTNPNPSVNTRVLTNSVFYCLWDIQAQLWTLAAYKTANEAAAAADTATTASTLWEIVPIIGTSSTNIIAKLTATPGKR